MADDGKVQSSTGKVETDPISHLTAVLLPGILCNDTSILIDDPNFASPTGSPVKTAALAKPTLTNKDHAEEGKDLDSLERADSPSEMPAFEIQGDPTESCIITLMAKIINPVETRRLKKSNPRVEEVPFDSAVKYMATMHDFYCDELSRLLQIDLSSHPLLSSKYTTFYA